MIIPLEQQVCSVMYAQELAKLGVSQDSVWYWYKKADEDKYRVYGKDPPTGDFHIICSAYTVAELGELLRSMGLVINCCIYCSIYTDGRIYSLIRDKKEIYFETKEKNRTTEADARATMLIYLLWLKRIK